jgi:hypothetical protein
MLTREVIEENWCDLLTESCAVATNAVLSVTPDASSGQAV